jgi:GntR family transcriptional regulator
LRAIRSDAFPDGRLPPEAELAESLGVSRTTVRAALQSLAADGLISRRRRLGTFVNAHLLGRSMRLNRLVPFTHLIRQVGREPSVDPQIARRGVAGDEVAEALGIGAGAPCLVVDRLLRADGAPVIAVTDVVPAEQVTVDLAALPEAESTFEFLAAIGLGPVDYAASEFIPRVATRTAPRGLDLAAGTAYIELLETHFTRDHERIAVSRVTVDDAVVRLSLLRRDL